MASNRFNNMTARELSQLSPEDTLKFSLWLSNQSAHTQEIMHARLKEPQSEYKIAHPRSNQDFQEILWESKAFSDIHAYELKIEDEILHQTLQASRLEHEKILDEKNVMTAIAQSNQWQESKLITEAALHRAREQEFKMATEISLEEAQAKAEAQTRAKEEARLAEKKREEEFQKSLETLRIRIQKDLEIIKQKEEKAQQEAAEAKRHNEWLKQKKLEAQAQAQLEKQKAEQSKQQAKAEQNKAKQLADAEKAKLAQEKLAYLTEAKNDDAEKLHRIKEVSKNEKNLLRKKIKISIFEKTLGNSFKPWEPGIKYISNSDLDPWEITAEDKLADRAIFSSNRGKNIK